MKHIIAYVPVLHAGYLNFFRKHQEAQVLYLIGEDILLEFPELDYVRRKDALRALAPEEMTRALRALNIFKQVKILHLNDVPVILATAAALVAPDEDVTRLVIGAYFRDMQVTFDSVFLRWHRGNVEQEHEIVPDRVLNITNFDKECMSRAMSEGEKSLDWWRQVGGIIVKDGEPILWAHNVHVPFPEMPSVYGDPRSMWSRGVRIELTTAEHVESVLVAEAARRGLALASTDLYITDFPCPPCAKLIARAGFRRLYYAKGSYAMLQGESIVRSNGAEIVRVIV